MARGRKKAGTPKQIETLRHNEAKRRNIPTAELQSAAQRAEELQPFEPVVYQRRHPLAEGDTRPRDPDLDPQLVWKGARVRLTADQISEAAEKGYINISDAQLAWRGKDQQDWSDLVVQAPPLYIQEKVHPKAIIDDLARRTKEKREAETDAPDLFHDFNGIDPEATTEFYQHDQNWTNRFILGDSLQVMASLAERENLKGQIQAVYFDPPYGISFRSNWQVSTQSRDVKDGKIDQISREPEQVRAFRDTWKDGIHSYLTYLRDRITAMRDMLTNSGSIFVQIGEENVHRVRAILDEVFGEDNNVVTIILKKKSATTQTDPVNDYILWYARDKKRIKLRTLYSERRDPEGDTKFNTLISPEGEQRRVAQLDDGDIEKLLGEGWGWYRVNYPLVSQDRSERSINFEFQGKEFECGANRHWTYDPRTDMQRLAKAGRIFDGGGKSLGGVVAWRDWAYTSISNIWTEFHGEKFPIYVVQTNPRVVERCLLMTTDPGDLVLDPTCGSGTTATVAEQWGRRWITIDTSRVAMALARARVMGAKYPYYYLSDSKEGRQREAEITGRPPVEGPTFGNVRQGFVYDRAPHITLKSIADNAEIDVIWAEFKERLDQVRLDLNVALGQKWQEWEVPRMPDQKWPDSAKVLHKKLWEIWVERQKAMDASIARKADVELLYDRPIDDKSRVRVAGPFTVESLSPHRVVPSNEMELTDDVGAVEENRHRNLPKGTDQLNDFTDMILEHLSSSGVQQAKKDDRIKFESITGWPGIWIAADGRFMEGGTEKRAAIFIGPEFGTVSRADLTAAAREALDAGFEALIACGFNFEAHTSELNKLGPLPILKAKMNPELHMSDELKNTGAGNLFVVFGEPDIEWDFNDEGEIVVEVLGVDVFDPKTGDVRASGKDDIAAWFIDTDYNEESFFVRHAYFMGANDPYKSLKTALKAEIDEDAWATLYRDTSRPFPRPETGRFAVKVINHFGDEVMKVFAV